MSCNFVNDQSCGRQSEIEICMISLNGITEGNFPQKKS